MKNLLGNLGFTYIGDKFYEPTGLYHPSYEMQKSLGNQERLCYTLS